jgi:hypothetical protein
MGDHVFEKRRIKNEPHYLLIAGAIVGYIASRIMRTNSQQGLLLILSWACRRLHRWLFHQPSVGHWNDQRCHHHPDHVGHPVGFRCSAVDLQAGPPLTISAIELSGQGCNIPARQKLLLGTK